MSFDSAAHCIWLAVKGVRRAPFLTGLMVLSISLGMAVCMSMNALVHAISRNPLPERGGALQHLQLRADASISGDAIEPPEQLNWSDAMSVLRNDQLDMPKAAFVGGQTIVTDQASRLRPFEISALYATSDFFRMFRVPLLYGRTWTSVEEASEARVAVISSRLALKLFGSNSPVGRTLTLSDSTFTVIGVIKPWNLRPHFYDTSRGAYSDGEDIYVPLASAISTRQRVSTNLSCSGNWSGGDLRASPCMWLSLWVQIKNSEDEHSIARALEELKGGSSNGSLYKLRDVSEWIDYKKMVPQGLHLQQLIAFGFLMLCIVDTAMLFVAKSMRQLPELGLRRAVGASKFSIFGQLVVDAGLIGCLGGVFGVLFASVGILALSYDYPKYAGLIEVHGSILAITFLLVVVGTLFAALVPSLRAAKVSPADVIRC